MPHPPKLVVFETPTQYCVDGLSTTGPTNAKYEYSKYVGLLGSKVGMVFPVAV